MIQSLKLRNMYEINVNANGKFVYDEVKMDIKDVPFIRFRLDKYTAEAIGYIKGLNEIFKYSTMLIELDANSLSEDDVNAVKDLDDTCAIFLYIDIHEENLKKLTVSENIEETCIEHAIETLNVDRVCLVDKTDTLNAVIAADLIESVAEELFTDAESISICSSPLSCTGMACLTAVKARELMAEYSTVDDVPLPTANHEKSCCGCIQYLEIEHNTDRVIEKSTGGKREPKEKKESSEKKPKKVGISFGAMRF